MVGLALTRGCYITLMGGEGQWGWVGQGERSGGVAGEMGVGSYAVAQCKAHAYYLWCRACYTPAYAHSYVRAEMLEP